MSYLQLASTMLAFFTLSMLTARLPVRSAPPFFQKRSRTF